MAHDEEWGVARTEDMADSDATSPAGPTGASSPHASGAGRATSPFRVAATGRARATPAWWGTARLADPRDEFKINAMNV